MGEHMTNIVFKKRDGNPFITITSTVVYFAPTGANTGCHIFQNATSEELASRLAELSADNTKATVALYVSGTLVGILTERTSVSNQGLLGADWYAYCTIFIKGGWQGATMPASTKINFYIDGGLKAGINASGQLGFASGTTFSPSYTQTDASNFRRWG